MLRDILTQSEMYALLAMLVVFLFMLIAGYVGD